MSHDGEIVLTEAPVERWAAPAQQARPATQAEVAALLALLPRPERFGASLHGDRITLRYIAEWTARNSERDALAEVDRAAQSLGWDSLVWRGVADVYPRGQECPVYCGCDRCEVERHLAEVDDDERRAGQSDGVAA